VRFEEDTDKLDKKSKLFQRKTTGLHLATPFPMSIKITRFTICVHVCGESTNQRLLKAFKMALKILEDILVID